MKKKLLFIGVPVVLVVVSFIVGFFIGKHIEHKYMLSESGEGEYIDARTDRERKKLIGIWRKPNAAKTIEEYKESFRESDQYYTDEKGTHKMLLPTKDIPYTIEFDKNYNFVIREYSCSITNASGCKDEKVKISKGVYSDSGFYSNGYYIIKEIKGFSSDEYKETREQVNFYLYDENTLRVTFNQGRNQTTIDLIK